MSDRLEELREAILGQVNAYTVMKGGKPNAKTLGAYTAIDNIMALIQSYIGTKVIEGNKDRIAELELLNEALIVVPNHETKEMWRAVPMSYIENRLVKLKLKGEK